MRRSGDGRQLYRHVCYSRYGDGCDAASVCGVTSAAAALGQITLNWNAATDDNTPTANIVYQVYQRPARWDRALQHQRQRPSQGDFAHRDRTGRGDRVLLHCARP